MFVGLRQTIEVVEVPCRWIASRVTKKFGEAYAMLAAVFVRLAGVDGITDASVLLDAGAHAGEVFACA